MPSVFTTTTALSDSNDITSTTETAFSNSNSSNGSSSSSNTSHVNSNMNTHKTHSLEDSSENHQNNNNTNNNNSNIDDEDNTNNNNNHISVINRSSNKLVSHIRGRMKHGTPMPPRAMKKLNKTQRKKVQDAINQELHNAMYSGDIDAINRLIDLGADVNAKDACGQIPLHIACLSTDPSFSETLLLLASHSAVDVNATDMYGRCALHLAVANAWSRSRYIVAHILITRKANVNACTIRKWTPLHFATRDGKIDLAAMLLDGGADPNVQDDNGWTPLHWSAFWGHDDVCELLLCSQADPNVADSCGWTPLHYCTRNGDVKTMSLLLAAGAKPNMNTALLHNGDEEEENEEADRTNTLETAVARPTHYQVKTRCTIS